MLPQGWRDRAGHMGRIAGAAALAGARRVVRRSEADDDAFGEALVGELDTMKGLAMKVGQMLSYLDGAVPPATAARLAGLQRGHVATPWAELAPVVEAALGAPVAAVFASVDPTPVASASIGQVHRAVWRGRDVAVKVQHPGVRETFEADVGNLRRIAGVASLASRVDGAAIVADLRDRLLEECDYAHEAAQQRAFRAAFAGDSEVVVPEVIDAASAREVLTTAWVDGAGLDDVLGAPQEARDRWGAILARFTWRSMFRRAIVHADPHPGNQRYLDGAVAFLDFGCVRAFPADWLAAERRLVRAVLDDDRPAFRAAVIDAGHVGAAGFDFDEHWAMERWMWAPYLGGRYRFAPGIIGEARRFKRVGNPNARKLAIPPAWTWLARVLFGLHASLGRLGAAGRFDELLRAELDAPVAG